MVGIWFFSLKVRLLTYSSYLSYLPLFCIIWNSYPLMSIFVKPSSRVPPVFSNSSTGSDSAAQSDRWFVEISVEGFLSHFLSESFQCSLQDDILCSLCWCLVLLQSCWCLRSSFAAFQVLLKEAVIAKLREFNNNAIYFQCHRERKNCMFFYQVETNSISVCSRESLDGDVGRWCGIQRNWQHRVHVPSVLISHS